MNKNKINKNLKIQFNNNYLLYKYINYVKFIFIIVKEFIIKKDKIDIKFMSYSYVFII